MQSAKVSAEPLVVGYSAVSSGFLQFWIGKEAGVYKKEGLDAVLVYIASSTTMAQAMFARQVAISSVNSDSVVTSTLQGGNRVIGNLANEGIYFVIAGLTTTRRYRREQRGEAKAFLRAFGRATHFMFQQKDEAKRY